MFEFYKVLFKCFFRKVGSEQSYCLALNETVFDAWWVARSEVCVLEGFGRLVVSVDVQDGVLCESFPFEHCGVEETVFFSDISTVNLIVGRNLLAW